MNFLTSTLSEQFLVEEFARVNRYQDVLNEDPRRLLDERHCPRTPAATDRSQIRYKTIRSVYIHRQRYLRLMAEHFTLKLWLAYDECKMILKELQQDLQIIKEKMISVSVDVDNGFDEGSFPINMRNMLNLERELFVTQKCINEVIVTLSKFKVTCESLFVSEWEKLPGHLPIELRNHIASYLVPTN